METLQVAQNWRDTAAHGCAWQAPNQGCALRSNGEKWKMPCHLRKHGVAHGVHFCVSLRSLQARDLGDEVPRKNPGKIQFPGKKSLEIRMSSTRNSDIRKASANEISTHRFKEPYRVFSSRQREESGVRSQEMKETALINCEQNDCGQS